VGKYGGGSYIPGIGEILGGTAVAIVGGKIIAWSISGAGAKALLTTAVWTGWTPVGWTLFAIGAGFAIYGVLQLRKVHQIRSAADRALELYCDCCNLR
jgi:hypothetical protein